MLYVILLHKSARISTRVNEFNVNTKQWHTQDFFLVGGRSTNSVEDKENGDLGAAAP
jgi:hypothetical protein